MLARTIKSGMLTASTDAAAVARARFVVCIIGTPVDEHLNPSFTAIDSALDALPRAPARRPDPDPAQHRLPRHQPSTSSATSTMPACSIEVAFCPERVAQGLQPARVPRAAADHLAPSTPRALAAVRGAVRPLRARVRRDGADGGRAVQADDQRLALHLSSPPSTSSTCSPPSTASTSTASCTAAATTIRAWPACPAPGFAAGPCLVKDTMQLAAFSHNHFVLGHSAMLVNEGLPQPIVVEPSASSRPDLGAMHGRHPGHGLQGRERRPARLAGLQAQEAPDLEAKRGAVHRSLRARSDPGAARARARARRTSSSSATPHTADTSTLQPPRASGWSTSGTACPRTWRS